MRFLTTFRSFAYAFALLSICLIATNFPTTAKPIPAPVSDLSVEELPSSSVEKIPTSNCENDSRFDAIADQNESIENKLRELELRVSKLEKLQTQPVASAKVDQATVGSGSASSRPVVSNTVSAPVVVSSSSHWTYPGDIASHLSTTHGQDVSGLTTEQQLTLHDDLHEGRVVARSFSAPIVSSFSRSYSVQRTSSCPGGVCPTNGVQRTGFRLFRR